MNKKYYIVIGFILLIIIAVVFFYIKHKKFLNTVPNEKIVKPTGNTSGITVNNSDTVKNAHKTGMVY